MNATVASLIIALIGALAAIASQRSAAKSSKVSDQMHAEKGAYERARNFDIKTMELQEREIQGLQGEVTSLKAENRSQADHIRSQDDEIRTLKEKVARLEAKVGPE